MRDRASQASMKLVDCRRHAGDSELFVVEGDSAARSVVMLRDDASQAVLPLQGKPLNAWKAAPAKVALAPLYRQLAQALGLRDAITCDVGDLATLRYARVLLLFDPDADGIHIGALLLLYLHRFAQPLIDAGRVHMVRAPMFAITHAALDAPVHAYSHAHAQALLAHLRERGSADAQLHGYRGLGSLPPPVLRETCIDARTRQSRTVGDEDIAAVMQAFGIKR